MRPTTIEDLTTTTPRDDDVARAVTASVLVPIAALRATLDGLALDLAGSDPRRGTLARAGAEVEHVRRGVQALLEWAIPPELRALRSTPEEIARSAVASLPVDLELRTLVEIEGPAPAIETDGAYLARCLARLVDERSFDRCAVRVAHNGAEVSFLVAPIEAHDEPRIVLGLATWLARRDVPRLGGRVVLGSEEYGPHAVDVRLPSTDPSPRA